LLFVLSFLRVSSIASTEAEPVFGVTFSSAYATSLGLDWRRTYLATLDELQVKHLRLPVYWNEVNPSEGEYVWNDLDWMMEQAAAHGAEVTLAIGRKVPRWPECHIPTWVTDEQQSKELLAYLELLVMRYDASTALVRWQVENEPLFPFGGCPVPDPELLEEELTLVHSLSEHPIMLTASGENEVWIDTAIRADVLGVSLYRTTWNDLTGYFIYPLGPEFYRLKSALARSFVDGIVLSELQAEPWFQKAQLDTPLADQVKMFTPDELEEQLLGATLVGFDEIYLWGVEWWYWLNVQGEEEMWKKAKEVYGAL
jgi:hypothetical protein